jgi:hypothetical protein
MYSHLIGSVVLSACLVGTAAAAETLDTDYALSSHGLELIEMHTRVQLAASGYAISVHSKTVGIVGFLARGDVTSVASGRFDGVHVVPERFASSGHSRGADRSVRIGYRDGQPTVELSVPAEPDRDPVPVAATAGSIDTLSLVVGLSRQVAMTGRCDGVTLVFDGRRLSRLEAHTVGMEAVRGDAFQGAALRCDFVSVQLGGFLHDADRARLRKPLRGSAWLAPPVPGAPVAAVKAVFESTLGRATLRLTRASTAP